MKKLLIMMALTAILLCACQAKDSPDVSDYEENVAKAQEIAVYSADTPESIGSLTSKEEIEAFVLALNLDKWTPKTLPNGAVKIGSFRLSQEETIKLGQTDSNGRLHDAAEITLYDNGYVCLEAGGIELSFAVEKDIADYLNNFFE